ncbi:MAG: DUF3352 domain-containing protein [Leptolyngbya sp. DLM2.Bin27]|nr:MAG: DUF3352 domain-containing protein [Leptolyngbya sp. DLM2.Bin27]
MGTQNRGPGWGERSKARGRGAKPRCVRHWLAYGLLGAGLAGGSLIAPGARADDTPAWHHLPENTALVMLLDTTAATWGQLNQFQLFQLLDESLGYTPGPLALPYLPYGVDFATEVAPWVGDTAVVALLPAAPGALASMADHLVMVAPATSPDALNSFRATVFDLQGEAEAVVPVLGTNIYLWPGPGAADWGDGDGGDGDWGDEYEPGMACETELDPCNETPLEESGQTRSPHRAIAPQALRFNRGVGLPLTVQSLHADDGEFELELPMPVPGFGPGGLAIAFLPDALVAAATPEAIEQYLTLRQQKPSSLAASAEFQRTLTHRQRHRALVAVYGSALELLNFDPSVAGLPSLGLPLPLPSPPVFDPSTIQTLRSLNFGGTIEALVYPTAQGMQLRGRYYYDLAPFTFGLTPTVTEADSLLELLPASTYMLISGRDIAGLWQGLTRTLASASDPIRQGLDGARAFFTLATGLDLDRDLFGWMDGEVALAAFPTADSPFQAISPDLHLGLGLLLQTSDRATATQTLTTLADLAAGFDIAALPATVNRQPVTALGFLAPAADTPLDGETTSPGFTLLSHGWVTDNTLALVSGLGPMDRVMAPSPHDPLARFSGFRSALAPLPQPNNGYFYLNVGATLSLAYQVFDLHSNPLIEPLKPVLGSLHTLSATTAQTPNYLEVHGHLGLARRRD